MPTPIEINNLKAAIPAAQSAAQHTGVPASVTLAQWMLESGWGLSKLALLANNYFGIKAEHLNDPSTYREFPTTEWVNGHPEIIKAKFEYYNSEADSFIDHARLLSQAARYAPCMAVKDNAIEFANQLQACGYSTSLDPVTHQPNYGTKLVGLMNDFNLQQYDGV